MTQMVDSISIARNTIYKGAARVAYRAISGTVTAPTQMRDLMYPTNWGASTKYELATGFTDVGGTTEDGVTISREASLSEGIPVDQKKSNIDAGDPEDWKMSAECTLLDTSLAKLSIIWQTASPTALSGQKSIPLDAPATIKEYELVFIQEDPTTSRIRAIWLRKAKIDPSSELKMTSDEASTIPAKWNCHIDETIAEGAGQFGLVFEMDAT